MRCFNSYKPFQGADVEHWHVYQCLAIHLKNKYIVLTEAAAQMQSDAREMEEVQIAMYQFPYPNLSNSVSVGLREFVSRDSKTIHHYHKAEDI
jgi:hypothetical protein